MTVTVRASQAPRTIKVTAGAAPGEQPRAFLRPVIETMIRIQRDGGGGVFGFTAPNPGAGTTFVVNLLARDLAAGMPCSVAIVPTQALDEEEPAKLPQGYVEHAPNIWVAVADRELERLPDKMLDHVWIGSALRSFDFVLVDTPALTAGSQALRVSDAADGMFLVVEAGKSRVEQIEQAQELLRSSSDRLKGIILNRRTYAIPRLIFKLL
jgi:hypothetical protein